MISFCHLSKGLIFRNKPDSLQYLALDKTQVQFSIEGLCSLNREIAKIMLLPDNNSLVVMFTTNDEVIGNPFLDDLLLIDIDNPSNRHKMGCKAVIDFVPSNCGKTLFVVDDEDAKKNRDICNK